MTRAAAGWTLILLWALPVAGEVKVVVRPDGTTLITNDAPARSRPAAARPVAVPARDLAGLIDTYARGQRLDPELVRVVIQVESGYDHYALSARGAMGLMQLMPETALRLTVGDAYDPEENLRGGTAYLRRMLDLFDGRLDLALAGYNAGPEAVRRFGGIPPFPETRAYVETVLRLYRGEDAVGPSLTGGRVGRKVFVTRTADDRIFLTTTPPEGD